MTDLAVVFYWVLNISLAGSLVSVFVLVCRRIFKYNFLINTLMWVVLMIRFTIPVSYLSQFSIMGLYELLDLNISSIPKLSGLYFNNIISLVKFYDPMTFNSKLIYYIFLALSIVWIFGIVTILYYWFFTQKKIKLILNQGADTEVVNSIKTIESSEVKSPFMFGLLAPVILIPTQFPKKDLDFVLVHEKAHFQHRDNLKRSFALLICLIHWFNPLVWISFKAYVEDLEIEADRQAIKWIGEDKKADYLLTILRLSSKNKAILGASFSSNPLVRRIETQVTLHDKKYEMTWLFGTLIVVVFVVLLANI